jgi:hypothetical protein
MHWLLPRLLEPRSSQEPIDKHEILMPNLLANVFPPGLPPSCNSFKRDGREEKVDTDSGE